MQDIVEYYNNYNEEGRLEKDNAHCIEFLTTVHILDSLVRPGMKILDMGCGTGAYTLHLAGLGMQYTSMRWSGMKAF